MRDSEILVARSLTMQAEVLESARLKEIRIAASLWKKRVECLQLIDESTDVDELLELMARQSASGRSLEFQNPLQPDAAAGA